MVTVHREQGFAFIIFTDDHLPAHVHVFGDGHAKVNLLGPSGAPELVTNAGFKAGDLRKAMRIVTARQVMLLAKWRALHG